MSTATVEASKTRICFFLFFYLFWLIDSGAACNVPALMIATGMPMRTSLFSFVALAELDIDCHFEQEDGERNNAGHYRIRDWGPLNREWIASHLPAIKAVLGYR